MNRARRRITACGVVAMLAMAATSATPATNGGRSHPEDLAHLNYPFAGQIGPLLGGGDAAFDAFAAPVRNDVDWLLDEHLITDRTALRTILSVRLAFEALSEREDNAALMTLTQIRDLEDKPAARMITGIEVGALLKARLETGAAEGPDLAHAYARILSADLRSLPWDVVGESVRLDKMRADVTSPALTLGAVDALIGSSFAQTHTLSAGQAWAIVTARLAMRDLAPLQPQTEAVLSAIVAAHTETRPEIWAAREVTFSSNDRLTPVTVGIWDSGTDLSQFPGQVYADPKPSPGADPHGLAFDLKGFPTHGELFPIDAGRLADYPRMVGELQGFTELEAMVSSPQADALKKKLAAMTPDQVGQEIDDLNYFAEYVHGTHVAGIAARGNPAVRLAVARLTFDWRRTPEPPTEEEASREAEDYMTYVRWFRDHGVRVVNMSWEETEAEIAEALEKAGVGGTLQARVRLATRLFQIESDGLKTALESAPDILFVCAAGNSGGDIGSLKGIPSTFVLPNLLVVGAVDGAGEETGFTNYGSTVRVDADGQEVESALPGGFRARLSGTSMASPNVVNLAAKLLALDPRLTPPQVIDLIIEGTTPSADGRVRDIDPKRSVELLRQMQGGRKG